MSQNKFNQLIEKHEAILQRKAAVSGVVGYIKLFLVLLLGISLYFTATKGFPVMFILISGIELITLIAFWIYHSKLHKTISYLSEIININKRHLDRISGKWCDFRDIGEEFIDTEHAYACDLDIVGRKSLFQFLNTTHTWYGRRAFASDLLQHNYTDVELLKRQEAILELSKDTEFYNQMEYYFSRIGADNSAGELVRHLKDKKTFIKSKAAKIILIYAPLFTLIFIAVMLVFGLKSLYLTGAILVLVQAIIWIAGLPKTYKYLGALAHLPYKLSAYSTAIEFLKNRKFTSEKLKQIKAKLGTSNCSAAVAIKELGKIADKVSVKHNGIIYFILNVFLLWDYRCAFAFAQWKIKYADLSETWFLALGEFESILCFSNLPNICDHTCLPLISDVHKIIEATAMGHPLLPNDIRVNNNIKCNNNIFIISGSNMSGKTTFLRTVGINLVLARTGCFVCAGRMTFFPFEIITSMRIADDLNEGISTFYAELKRIKRIIELAEKEPNMIFLIDEIFRGTNSKDRLSGAKAVISKLNGLGITGIITTHDLDLCELENQFARIRNYSFSEHYKNNKICFDYRINSGKSDTTNAKYLMEMVGIL